MRKKAAKHTTLPDPKYGQVQVTKFVNNLMYDGKKSKSFDIFYNAIDIVAEKSGEDGTGMNMLPRRVASGATSLPP